MSKRRPGLWQDERGVALLMTLLVLIIVTTLAAGMTFSGRTEVLVSRNYETAAVAMGAAEGGVNHAVEITSANLAQWQANGFVNASAAITALLRGPDNATGTPASDADNGSLENLGPVAIPRPPAQMAMGAAFSASYEARVYDEDDAARGVTLSAADIARIGEDGNATTDANNMVLVQAIGYGPDNTSVTLEATLRPISLPAVVTGGDLRIDGDLVVAGTEASVHSNDDLNISGDVTIGKDATASGSFTNTGDGTIAGQFGGSFAELPLPTVSAIDYRSNADYVLTSTGELTNLAGTITYCNAFADPDACEPVYGWLFQGGEWRSQDTVLGGTYYVETDVRVQDSPTATLTLITEGSIRIDDDPTLTPDTPSLLFVTDGDIRMDNDPVLTGQMLVHEQLDIRGDAQIVGQILVEDAATASGLVTENRIRDDATITYNGTFAGSLGFTLSAWREVR